MKKWMYAAVALVVAAGGGYFGYGYLTKEEPAMATPVQTAVATRDELTVTVSGSGVVSVVSSKEVTSDEEGELQPLLVREGDIVEKGQVLAYYDAPDVEEQLNQTRRSLEKQEMQFEQLKKKYIAAGDDARDDVAYEIEALKLDMETNREKLVDLEEEGADVKSIAAPIAGKVTSIDVLEDGQRVQQGAKIATIVDYDNLQTVIRVDELDISKVRLGQAAKVLLDALEDTEIAGVVTAIADEGTAEGGVSLFDVTIEFPAQERIRVGMTSTAEIVTESKEDVLLLPIEAVREAGGRKFVMLADGEDSGPAADDAAAASAPDGQSGQRQAGQADIAAGNMRPVTVGAANESMIEIVDGLEEGDVVVLPAVVVSSGGQTATVHVMGGGMGGGARFVAPAEGGGGGMARSGQASGGGGGR